MRIQALHNSSINSNSARAESVLAPNLGATYNSYDEEAHI
jgi:hypothetical protein